MNPAFRYFAFFSVGFHPLVAALGPAEADTAWSRAGPRTCTAQDWATEERREGLTAGQAVLRFVKLCVAFLTFQGENNIC